jgi:hypothetical protein
MVEHLEFSPIAFTQMMHNSWALYGRTTRIYIPRGTGYLTTSAAFTLARSHDDQCMLVYYVTKRTRPLQCWFYADERADKIIELYTRYEQFAKDADVPLVSRRLATW